MTPWYALAALSSTAILAVSTVFAVLWIRLMGFVAGDAMNEEWEVPSGFLDQCLEVGRFALFVLLTVAGLAFIWGTVVVVFWSFFGILDEGDSRVREHS